MRNIISIITMCLVITSCAKFDKSYSELRKLKIIGNIENQAEIKNISDIIISVIIDQNFIRITKYVNDKKGLLITMYPVIALKYDPVFTKQQISKFKNTKEEYKWGLEEGSGEMFLGTPNKFFSTFMDIELNRISRVGMNTMLTTPGYKENQWDVFSNSIVIEYYVNPSSEFSGMDWLSVRLIFEKIDNKYYLVGLTSHHLEI